MGSLWSDSAAVSEQDETFGPAGVAQPGLLKGSECTEVPKGQTAGDMYGEQPGHPADKAGRLPSSQHRDGGERDRQTHVTQK